VTNAGHSPATVTVAYGGRVTWLFKQGTPTVTDASRMHQYTSGTKAAGATYKRQFINSGTFLYHSVVGPAISGQVLVPMTVTPSSGSRTTFFTVRWGSDYAPTGYDEQVHIKEPRTTKWIYAGRSSSRARTRRSAPGGRHCRRRLCTDRLGLGKLPTA